MGVDDPGAHYPGVITEDLLKALKKEVHQPLPLGRGIAHREAHIGVPVPREASPPGKPRRLTEGLHDLQPDAQLILPVLLTLHHRDKGRVEQRVILQKESAGEPVAGKQRDLLLYRLVEVHLAAGLAAPDKVDNVQNLFLCHGFFLTLIDYCHRRAAAAVPP